jgi:hypothetical protein
VGAIPKNASHSVMKVAMWRIPSGISCEARGHRRTEGPARRGAGEARPLAVEGGEGDNLLIPRCGHQLTDARGMPKTSSNASPLSSIPLIFASVTLDGPHSAMGMKEEASGERATMQEQEKRGSWEEGSFR